MLELFQKYIEEEKLFRQEQKVLLAVSGGVDSMVMLHLFRQAGYNFVVAHCNFLLRGDESDGDEQFVTDYCEENNIRLFKTVFDTKYEALQRGMSIEMAARDLRYNWFDELLSENDIDYLATAHHQDDVLETFFINLGRGTGIRGLSGIKPKTGKLIRPLLFADRLSIQNYAALQQIKSREDSSNTDTAIRRNFIRHKVLPLLDEYHSAFRKNMIRTIDNLNETEFIFQQKIEELRQNAVKIYDWGEAISITDIKGYSAGKTILFELLRGKGFSSDQLDDIFHSLGSSSGKRFYSSTHRLVKDRAQLIITPVKENDADLFYIEKDCVEINIPVSLKFEVLERADGYHFSKNPLVADFDYEKLDFPLILRKWKEGEYFQPLGMEGLKKLSDFFIDEKMSIPEKESTWILACGSRVVWIVGKRLDNRFKISPNTRRIFRVTITY